MPSFAAAARPKTGAELPPFVITFDDDDPTPQQASAFKPAQKPAVALPTAKLGLPPAKLESEIVRMRNAIARQEQARLASAPKGASNGAAPFAKKGPKGVAAVKPSPKKAAIKKPAAAASAAKAPPFSVRAPAGTDAAPGVPRDKTALLTAAASADDFLKAMAAGAASGHDVAAKPALVPLKRAFEPFPSAAPAKADAEKRPRMDADPPRAKNTVRKSPLVVNLKQHRQPPPVPLAAPSGPSQTALPAAFDAANAAPMQRQQLVAQPQNLARDELQLVQHSLDEAEIAEQRLIVRQLLASNSTPELRTELAEAAARRISAQAKVAAAQATLSSASHILQQHGADAPAAHAPLQPAALALPAAAYGGAASRLIEELRLKRRAELRSLAMACDPGLVLSNAAPSIASAGDTARPSNQVEKVERGSAGEQDRSEDRFRRPDDPPRRARDLDGARARESPSPRDKGAGRRQSSVRSPAAVTKAAKQPKLQKQPPPQQQPSDAPSAPSVEASLIHGSVASDQPAVTAAADSAASSLPAHPPLLFAAGCIATSLQTCTGMPEFSDPEPSVTHVPSSGAYESPLFALRSVRVLPQYTAKWRLETTCPTFSHAIDPLWPLCPFDLRGECRDASCPWQSKADMAISRSELVSDLESLGAFRERTATGKESGVPCLSLALVTETRARRRPTRPPVAELLVPTFIRAHGCGGPARAAVFRTGLLAPAAAFAALPAAADQVDERVAAADARVGRYHSLPEEDALEKASIIESQLLEDPGDVASWLHFGLSKIDFNFDNAAAAMADSALTVLARGLEVNSSCPALWAAYLRIFSRRFTLAESRDMMEHALKYVPASPLLWRIIVELHDEPQSAASFARRAIAALCTAAKAASPGSGAVVARGAALDAGLNALAVACDFEDAAELGAWAAALEAWAPRNETAHAVQDASRPSTPDAVACLLQVLSGLQTAILMTAAAEAVELGRLPLVTSAAAGHQHPDALPAIRWPSLSSASDRSDVSLKLLRCAVTVCSRDSAYAAAVAAENYLCALAARRGAAAALAALPELQAALPSRAPLAPLLRCTFALVGAVEDREAALERVKILLTTAPDAADLSEARIDFLAILARTRSLEEAAALAGRWMDARGSAPDTAWSLLIFACSAVGSGNEVSAVFDIFERALGLSQAADEAAIAARERVFLEYLAFVAQCVVHGKVQRSFLGALLARRAREAVANLPAPVERFESLRDARVRALLETRAPTYTVTLAGGGAAAFRPLPLDAMVEVAEMALDASPGAVSVALEAARRASATAPAVARHAAMAWAVPLLAGALVVATPSPPPHIWVEAMQLCSDAPEAAHELACVGLRANPRCRCLRRVLCFRDAHDRST